MNRITAAVAAATAALLAVTATACSDGDVDKVKDRAASATARAGEAVSSATEAAASKMAEVKDGVDAKGDVKVDGGTKSDDKDDRTTAKITATNSTDKKSDYTISVNFRDGDGKLLDTAVLNIDGVEPSKSKSGTARSNRNLSGTPKAEIGKALRH